MTGDHEMLERGIPDLIDTAGLPSVLAAEIDFLAGRSASWTACGSHPVRARALVATGAADEALELLSATDLAACRGQDLVAASWAAARVGTPVQVEALLSALEQQSPLLFAGEVPLGPRALASGPLLAATGDLDAATARLAEAVTTGDERSPLWGALGRHELARVKLCARALDPNTARTDDIDPLLSAATLFFRAGGYRGLLARTEELTRPDPHSPPLGGPTVGRLRPGPSWQAGFGVMGDVAMRASKGLGMLRHLVVHATEPVPAVVLDRLGKDGDIDGFEAVDGANTAEIRALLMDEAVRSRVAKMLTRTISRIEETHPLLGRHLGATVRTGHACRYEPPGDVPVVWVT